MLLPALQRAEGEQLREALDFFGARELAYRKGEQLIRIGDAMPCFGLVLEGAVSVCSTDINGNRMIMASVGRGETFGESLSFCRSAKAPSMRRQIPTAGFCGCPPAACTPCRSSRSLRAAPLPGASSPCWPSAPSP